MTLMSHSHFNAKSKKVPLVKTQHRLIKTTIPAPNTEKILKEIQKCEVRSMHGQLPIIWDKAENFNVYDIAGNKFIDFTSTIFLANSGHANPHIIKALRKVLRQKLLHTYTFVSKVRTTFLKKLIGVTPHFCEKAFLLSSGTEATECALKLIRLWGEKQNPKKLGVISFVGNMHGRTLGAEMLKGKPETSTWIGYRDPNMYHLPFPYPWLPNANKKKYDWARHFEHDMTTLKKHGLDFKNLCGFIIESYQGWGAVFYPKTYLKALEKFAKKHGALIAFDEIQSGFGRTGKLFCYEHYNVKPDLLCLGKGLSGSLPLSAVIGYKKIMDLPDVGSMSSTHSANPMCCAAGLANIEALINQKLINKSKTLGEFFHKKLLVIKQRYPGVISDVQGKGLLAAVIFTKGAERQPLSKLCDLICEKAMQKGLLLVHTGRESIKLAPPLTISKSALKEGLATFEESIAETIKENPKLTKL